MYQHAALAIKSNPQIAHREPSEPRDTQRENWVSELTCGRTRVRWNSESPAGPQPTRFIFFAAVLLRRLLVCVPHRAFGPAQWRTPAKRAWINAAPHRQKTHRAYTIRRASVHKPFALSVRARGGGFGIIQRKYESKKKTKLCCCAALVVRLYLWLESEYSMPARRVTHLSPRSVSLISIIFMYRRYGRRTTSTPGK